MTGRKTHSGPVTFSHRTSSGVNPGDSEFNSGSQLTVSPSGVSVNRSGDVTFVTEVDPSDSHGQFSGSISTSVEIPGAR